VSAINSHYKKHINTKEERREGRTIDNSTLTTYPNYKIRRGIKNTF
jgi:hypothetical protein